MTQILPSALAVKAKDIIEAMLYNLRVYSPNQAIPGDEFERNLSALNSMLDSWSNDNLLIVSRTTENFSLTALDPTYSIGDGSDFDTERPVSVLPKASWIRDSSDNDYPLLPMTEEEWAAVSDKSPTSGSYPEYLWYNPKYPAGEINLYPIPQSGLTLYLTSEKPFNLFGDVYTSFSFPPGYRAAFEWNFTIWCAPRYGKSKMVTPDMRAMADKALSAIERKNAAAKPIKKTLYIPVGISSGVSNNFNNLDR